MKCCGRDPWGIYSPKHRRNIAAGCRVCNIINMVVGYEDEKLLAASLWGEYLRVFAGEGQGRLLYGKQNNKCFRTK